MCPARVWRCCFFAVAIAMASGAKAERIIFHQAGNICQMQSCGVDKTTVLFRFGAFEVSGAPQERRIDLPDDIGVGRGWVRGPDGTILPTYTVLLAVPQECRLSCRVLEDSITEVPNFALGRASAEDDDWVAQSVDGVVPAGEQMIRFEYAGQMRDLALARLIIVPVDYSPEAQILCIHHKIVVELQYSGGQILPPDGYLSEAFVPLYRAFLLNSSLLEPARSKRGAYWFIVHDTFMTYINSLTEWKTAKGFEVKVYPLSIVGYNPSATQILNFISVSFNAANPKPDYICLVGDVDLPGGGMFATYTYANPYGFGNIDSDNYYTFLVGQDYFPDVLIGRIAVDNSQELLNYIAKHFDYERNPTVADTGYYKRAVVVSGAEGSYLLTPRLTKLWCREMMLANGFLQVDTFFVTDYWSPSPSEISAAISRGVAFVNYRGFGTPDGWSSPTYTSSNLGQITNGPKYGVMHSIVCGTGDYYDYVNSCFGETWIRLANKGGPGFVGNTNHDAHTKWSNAIDCGIYWGLFMTRARTLAQSQLCGKLNLYLAFPEDAYRGGQVELYFNSYNDLGDPELNCWTAVPKPMVVDYPDTIALGPGAVLVQVTDSARRPVPDAYVCVWKIREVFWGEFTDSNGVAGFQVQPASLGQIRITVTGPNYVPFEGTIEVVAREPYVGVSTQRVDDDSIGWSGGDGDSLANPGETVELFVSLRNYGQQQMASGVRMLIEDSDSLLRVVVDSALYGTIAPGDSALPSEPLVVQVSPRASCGMSLPLRMVISDAAGNHFRTIVYLPVYAPAIVVQNSAVANDPSGNGILDPGETAQLVIELHNQGKKMMRCPTAVLRSADSLVIISDSVSSFADIDTNESVANYVDPFIVGISPSAYDGHRVHFTLGLTDSSQNTVQELSFALIVGTVGTDDPFGPDSYGYYCFDNTDVNYPSYPRYAWVDIDTLRWNRVRIYDDSAVVIDLPFPVRFYGREYSQAAVSDNGFLGLGPGWWCTFQNAQIPGPQCAPAMLAPFWDDLVSGTGLPLSVYHFHDQQRGRFIVGWRNAYNNATGGRVTFEVLLLDQAYWPTATGDNEIIFQYQQVGSSYSASVGICNHDRTIGLQYQFNQIRDPAAAALQNGRAIKFTTGSQYTLPVFEVESTPLSQLSLCKNWPNPFNSATTIEIVLPEPSDVTLDILDILGHRVRRLVQDRLPAGMTHVLWDGKDSRGQSVTSGVYFYRITASGAQTTKKMIMLK